MEHRHKGIGEQLVNHVLEYSRIKNIQMVSIGIIAEHIAAAELKLCDLGKTILNSKSV